MNNKNQITIISSKQRFERCLSESDFYPPADDRTWKSNVMDIPDGDCFEDYCEYIFNLYDKEGCWE